MSASGESPELIAAPVLELSYAPGLFAGLRARTIALDEYDEPYDILEPEPGSPLLALLARAPLLRISVPSDLRKREAIFRALDTRVTRALHSQPPHQDHPHRPRDVRRYNLFWAEEARANASTYFLPLALSGAVAAWLSTRLRDDPDAWRASQPKLAAYAEDPLRMSRYLVPAPAVHAYVGLVRDGEQAPWARLTDFGRIMTVARILGNTPYVTAILPGFFAWVEARWPGALTLERWAEPCLLVADDTRLLHGRFGEGESGGGFFRIWLAGPPGVGAELSYLGTEHIT